MVTNAWPRPGDALTLHVDGRSTTLLAVVDEVQGDQLLMREPYDPSGRAVDQPPPGSRLWLRWTDPNGVHACEGVLSGVHLDRVPLWVVPVDEPTVEQRRQFVRVAAALPVVVRVDGTAVEAVVCDLSEGGSRCVLVRSPELSPGDAVQLELVLEDQPLRLPATVLHLQPLDADRTEARLRFLELGRAGSLVRRHVIAQQYRARAVRA